MAERIRNNEWQGDEELKNDLETYVKQNLQRNEILDFVSEKYPMYAWSLQSVLPTKLYQHQVYRLRC